MESNGKQRGEDLSGGPALDQLQLRDTLNRYLLARADARRSPASPTPELVQARRELVRVLESAGWQPPPAVQALLQEDTARRSA